MAKRCDGTEMKSPSRREVLAALAAVAVAPAGRILAGPFTAEDFEKLVPAEKRLSTDWVASLFERGRPEIWRGDELRYIGMPVGGICCGQLYLGGDGRLWHWRIFQVNYNRETDHNRRLDALTFGGHYAKPPEPVNSGEGVAQGFAIRTSVDGSADTRTLDREGFRDVTFRGEYPVGRVTYRDPGCPVSVDLEAFSPFIPLNARDSGIPATVMSLAVRNPGKEEVQIELAGWLQNAVCPHLDDPALGRRRNRLNRTKEAVVVECTAESANTGRRLEDMQGYGSMCLSLLRPDGDVTAAAQLPEGSGPERVFRALGSGEEQSAALPLDKPLTGAIGVKIGLKPGERKVFDFLVSWYFPCFNEQAGATGQMLQIEGFETAKRHYANSFDSAAAVTKYVAENFGRLAGDTRRWNETWYDSTLPYWFLDRTFVTLDCLATSTCLWFDSGRFWGWEGVDCCPGTCTHVWQYAQGFARIFPEIERDIRERVDFGLALTEEGIIGVRAEHRLRLATDGQAGTILRAYREHQMAPDASYLKRIWPGVRKAVSFLIAQDGDENGLIETGQPNTLDAAWYGPMGWISSLYLASVRAGAEMAREVGDDEFAAACDRIAAVGQRNILTLFNGEYFIHKPDPAFPKAINSNDGCHIDQVFGQSYAWQLGLPRVVPRDETHSALRSLWKYNFAPDAGAYREKHKEIKGARFYAMKGEAGLIMCTWPRGGDEKAVPGMADRVEDGVFWQGPGGYFDECMTGFEYQVASHMVWEGLAEEGLAVTRAVHDRYHASKRNPYNEIECSDHYSRAMASYGVFLAACGYEHHGPKGHLGFAPRLSPANFKAAFTAAEGWGTFSQVREGNRQVETITVKWGRLRLRSLAFEVGEEVRDAAVSVTLEGRILGASPSANESGRVLLNLDKEAVVSAGETMGIVFDSRLKNTKEA